MSKRDHLPSLLLLPPPPEPPSRVCLNAAYRPPLETALSKLKNREGSSILIVAVGCSLLSGDGPMSKSFSWSDAQSLLAGLYTIISVVCAKLSIGIDMNGGPDSVDARVVLIDYDRGRTFGDFQPTIEPNNTAIVDLPAFASAYHPWNYIFHVESDAGLQMNAEYLKFAEGVQTLFNRQLVPVDGGLSLSTKEAGGARMSIPTQTHQIVCLGGTFDHLHPGHKLLLTAGALLLRIPEPGAATPCQFVIGVTGDELLKNKKHADQVQSWDERARGVLHFLSSILELSREGWEEDYKAKPNMDEKDGDFGASFRDGTVSVRCVRIHDAFGPTITAEDITSLVVSGETRAGGTAVNERRAELGWRLLDIFEVDVLDADEITDEPAVKENFASKISSTAIRQLKAKSTSAPAPG